MRVGNCCSWHSIQDALLLPGWQRLASSLLLLQNESPISLHQRVNVTCTLVDDGRFAVAQVTLNRIIVRISIRSVDLNRHGGGFLAANGRLPLCQPRRFRVGLSFILQVPSLQPEQVTHLVVSLHLSNLLFHQLMVRYLGTKGLSRVRIGNRGITRCTNHSSRSRSYSVTSLLERKHRDLKPF